LLISAISIENYKRIRSIDLKVDADRLVVLIGGANANGKSSILDAFEAALGGKSAVLADPVRHGAESAGIRIEFEGGKLTVQRKINADGSSSLEVRDDLGAVRSPQAVLDKLVGKRFLDPRAFLTLKAGDQRQALLALVDKDGKIDGLDQRRKRVFDFRTEVNRDLTKATAERDRAQASVPAEVPAPIDVAELSAEMQAISDAAADLAARRNRHDAAMGELTRARQAIAAAEAALAQARANLAAAQAAEQKALAAVNDAPPASPPATDASTRMLEIRAQIAKAQEHNRQVAEVGALVKRCLELDSEVSRLQTKAKNATDEIAKIDTDKAAFLAAAALPVPGLGVAPDGVTFNGAPLSQASGAEQLRVALALAVAGNNELRDIWIRDGALLDDDSLRAVAEQAAITGIRVWIERVGDRDPGAVIIEDGSVKLPTDTAAPTQGSLFQ
jgi:DNA repair exonuclease SbcCD ATPase subunit